MDYPKISRWLLIFFFLLSTGKTEGQNRNFAPDADSVYAPSAPDYKKLHRIFAVQSTVYLGSLYVLSRGWYKNPLTDFHFKDDRRVWMQMDKAGHFFTAYQISHYTSEIYRNTGISRRQRILYGALSGFVFQTPIELLDGFSPEYGFSISDIAANVAGAAFFAGQMLVWDELKILPKFSAHLTPYGQIRPEVLGRNGVERLLKDYNGQTYWLSSSPGALFRDTFWPDWLCFSLGYSIDNMVAAETDRSIQMGYRPYRQYYLSMDIDLTRLPVKNRFLRNLTLLVNALKIPAPAVELNSSGQVRFHPMYF